MMQKQLTQVDSGGYIQVPVFLIAVHHLLTGDFIAFKPALVKPTWRTQNAELLGAFLESGAKTGADLEIGRTVN